MGLLAQALLPVAQRALEALAPPVVAFADATREMLKRVEPSLQTVGEAVVVLAEAFANIEVVGLDAFLLSSEALIILLEGLSGIIVGLGEGVVTFGLILFGLVRALRAVQIALTLGTLTFQPYLAAFALVHLDELPDPVIPPGSDQFVVHYTQAQPVLHYEGFCGACLRQFYSCYGFRGNGRR